MSSRLSESGSDEDDRHGTYADDDSVVSANVAEAQTLTRGGLDIESDENKKAGIMPRNRREWCIVIFAILLIVAAAAGTGVGLGFYFCNQGKNNPSQTSTPKDQNENSEPTPSPGSDDFLSTMEIPNDFAGFIQYHMIKQDISELASFADNGSGSQSPQQQARDWLVLEDIAQGGQGQPSYNTDDLVNDSRTSSYLDSATPAYRVAQRFAVAVFYFATKGEEWESGSQWLIPGQHECEFPGIKCEEVTIPSISLKDALQNPDVLPHYTDGSVETTMEQMIVEINLPENNLQGTLADEIMSFPFLRRLGLWSNQIEGGIPSKIGQLENLESLLLDDNMLTGGIATEIGLLQNLTMLSLGFNENMGGGIPYQMGNLHSLTILDLPNMSLIGGFPSSMQNLVNLEQLNVQSNMLRGAIPEWLGYLDKLKKLDLSENAFTGPIPESFSKLTNLRELELQRNDELGTIPCGLFEYVTLLSANCKSSDGTTCGCCTLCV